jgi:hypothetical protein
MNNEIDIKLLGPVSIDEPGYLYLKAQAKAMFLAGYQVKKIAEKLNIPNHETISGWAFRENWHEEREKVLDQSTKLRLQDLLSENDAHVSDLKSIREKAISAINEESVVPQKFSEATNSYITALDMERKLKMEALQISFINDIAIILREEIDDKLILAKIANRLNATFERYQNKSLLKSPNAEG